MAERVRPLPIGSAQLAGITELNKRFTALQKEFAELRDQLNVFENWNSEIKKMYTKMVRVTTIHGAYHDGILVWSDRYCVCIEMVVGKYKSHRQVLTKGNMISIELLVEDGE
jgi:uncharacterized small protein (DUF1192 family)